MEDRDRPVANIPTPPTTETSKASKLTVTVKLDGIELFKELIAATALMYDRADQATQIEVIEILKENGSAILITKER